MKKIETIWHYLLFEAIEKKEFKHTQKDISKYFEYSLSTVNLAVKQLNAIGALDVRGKFFIVRDVKKILYYWSTHRNFQKNILYETYVDSPISEIEGLMFPEAIFAGYTAAKYVLKEPSADYSKVYVYVDKDKIEEVKNRFPKIKSISNLVVLESYPNQHEFGIFTDITQTFVDIWNMNDWYAKDFLIGLERKIDGLLS